MDEKKNNPNSKNTYNQNREILMEYTNAVNTIEKYIQNTRGLFVQARTLDPNRFKDLELKLHQALNVLKNNVDYYPEE